MRYFFKSCLFIVLLLIITTINSNSQTFTVKGKISTALGPVKYVSISFINKNDTTKKFTAMTDTLGNYQIGLITSVNSSINNNQPVSFRLEQNYPNPFTSSTSISYNLNSQSDIRITIYDILGREIKKFAIGTQTAGTHNVIWDGKNNFGGNIASGVYFYRLEAKGEMKVKKMIFTNGSSVLLSSNRLSNLSKSNTYERKEVFTTSSVYTIYIKGIDSTQPQIYDEIYDDITIQGDTTQNFTLEAVGPWVKVKRGLNYWLKNIDFTDSLNGWTVGFGLGPKGKILHTDDGGESWQEQTCPVDDYLWGVDFVDTNHGWICSQSSILKTSNGGETWELKYTDSLGDGRFYDIEFLNDKIGFVTGGKGFLGSAGVLLKTSDGGETWKDITPQDLSTLTHISIVNEKDLWICGFGGAILLSTDLGITWTKKSLNSIASWIIAIQFIDQNHGWVACDDNDPQGFFRTTDGGNTWIQVPYKLYLDLGFRALCFVDSLHGWVSSILGADSWAIMNTTDGGQTWEQLPEGTNLYQIYSFCFINDNLGWAIGIEAIDSKAKGVILRYKNK